jgi:hypothetical protein
MMMKYHRNPVLEQWEDKLNEVFYNVDHYLEETYGSLYPLKPSRAPRGEAPTPDADGLFDLGVSFAAGFGSKYGPGYVFRVRFETLQPIDDKVRADIEADAIRAIRAELPLAFPDRSLEVVKDGAIYKIIGDLSLDRR